MDDRFQTPHSHPRWWYEGSFHPVCFDCTHFRGMVKGTVRCTVFPDGTPKEFFEKSMDRPAAEGSNRCFEEQRGDRLWAD